ncbi:hypothetical protein BKA67DRAFT_652891 [Truncatella angustata]|uniref:Uncharacterized protein n=1 Tax=Truncatella angustata TaxID=152316 RepID=A0A9P8UWG5_9PEZI|nr:uncharacterized protein BKA67DRAFT_652891 [Truncatella angustata]KAH6659668.1 hypothetical protein BKA67DRAFT_652891 [Truncatella angustata]
MSVQDNEQAAGFSWMDPHPLFVVFLVGPDETPFGIQKDFLCAKSTHFRRYFSEQQEDKLENIVHLSEFTSEVFGLAQNFMFTGRLSDISEIQGYDVYIAVWQLGSRLGIEGLCDTALEAMSECRRVTHTIPATPLLVQVWRDTPEGSEIRNLLLTWAAEYIRSSEARSEFSKSLPQEVLSELVVTMSHLNSAPVIQVSNDTSADGTTRRKNVHYLDVEDDNAREHKEKAPKHRHSISSTLPPSAPKTKTERKSNARASLPATKSAKSRKAGVQVNGDFQPTKEQKLSFCSDLLTRMLSGPGFWTRLVKPFRYPVDPVEEGVPDYPDKIKKPMDLETIKTKFDAEQYNEAEEFVADVRQIIDNCFDYWTDKDPMWAAGEKFQKTFEEKYSGMNKWIAKLDGEEPA